MMQKSVYSKIAINGAASKLLCDNVRRHKPPEGTVQILTITEKQYQSIEFIVGEGQREVLDTIDRFVVL